MTRQRLATYSSPRFTKQTPNYHLSQQAIHGLSNTLILTIGLVIAMLLSISHIYLLMLIQLN